MKTLTNTVLVGLMAAFVLNAAWAGYNETAERIVNQSLGVKPGEIVLINGSVNDIELMGAMQIAVNKAGGDPLLQLNIPKANKRSVMETPVEYLGQTRTSQLMLVRMVDAVINVNSIEDPDLFADVPEERLAATREGGAPLNAAFANASVRTVTLGQTGGVPTDAYAKSINADPKAMKDMFWKAVSVEPDALAMTARKISSMLAPGTTARLKTGDGTDLTFAIGMHESRVNAGRVADVGASSGPASVWLPAGEAYTCIDLDSANGTLVVPTTQFRGKNVKNLKISFRDGRMTELSAGSNEKMLQEFFAATDEATKRLSVISIGLNRESQPLKGSDYRSWEMGGMVTLGLGNNSWAGGDNDANGAFSTHLTGATLEVGQAKVVSDGALARVR